MQLINVIFMFNLFIILCEWMICLHIDLCTYRGQKRVQGTENLNLGSVEEQQVLYLLSYLSRTDFPSLKFICYLKVNMHYAFPS